ncbi:Abi family protein [Gardnerella vaginalis]|uniref:Abi family protein n=1 Tax=Gardnerella vaginalis TaxID=2702 RepID=UPI0003532BEB|nr:Abi family protein [Gardnerella vaginalis]EPI42036.1 Abi-like protein [Gardnerella vaginalis JCP8481A]EPI44117.1 Abi-like protein [Gardnerella vaginalis JCP8481B]
MDKQCDSDIKKARVINKLPVKLSSINQIEHLKKQGITFNKQSEDSAISYLLIFSYYFETCSYKKLFSKRVGGFRDGQYIDLDFDQLCKIEQLNRMFQILLLLITLAIEHEAKVKLMKMFTENPKEDGYSIVEDYMSSLYNDDRKILIAELERLKDGKYSRESAAKYTGGMPIWVFVEGITFGTLLRFYRFCAKRWGSREMQKEHHLLCRVKSVRNACAHSNSILDGITEKSFDNVLLLEEVSKAIEAVGFNKRARRSNMCNAKMKEIVITAYMYKKFLYRNYQCDECVNDQKSIIRYIAGGFIKKVSEYTKEYDKASKFNSLLAFICTVIDSWICER